MKTRYLVSLALLTACVTFGPAAGARLPEQAGDAIGLEAQPHMKAALVTLRVAKGQLQKASADKGGHRVKAIALVSQAISQVEKGMAYDDAHSTKLEADALEAQPHMQAARASLLTARNQLKKASHDKGGHRVAAIALVNDAIAEVDRGIAFDNAH